MKAEQGIVLFGHGARDPEWARPMQHTQAQLKALAPALPVELAFLEFMRPTLEEAVATLVARGARRIAVVPMFIAQGGHLKSDVPALLETAGARFPQCHIMLAPAVGEADGVVAAMAAYALECLGSSPD